MSDRRCGTCRHYTDSDGYSGHCAIGAFLGRATAFSGESGCPGWSDCTEYARGWRDAVAAAAALADECTHGDDLLRGLGRAIAALTPPGESDNFQNS